MDERKIEIIKMLNEIQNEKIIMLIYGFCKNRVQRRESREIIPAFLKNKFIEKIAQNTLS